MHLNQLLSAGGNHTLGEGQYTLEGPVILEKPVVLSGAGPNTIINITNPFPAPAISSYQGLYLRSLSLVCQETQPFEQSLLYIEGKYYLLGLHILGNSRTDGVVINQQASGQIRNCHISGCGFAIALAGQATGVIEKNTLQNNNVGILVAEHAQAKLSHNLCQINNVGIDFSEQSAGYVQNNTCQDNYCGIGSSGNSKPTLRHNLCQNNQESGIAILGNSQAKAEYNLCQNNKFGILLEPSPHRLLGHNTLQFNHIDVGNT